VIEINREKRMSETKNLWGGRFTGEADKQFVEFNRSFGFDRRLFAADVRASIAHCEGLRAGGVISAEEAARITAGLKQSSSARQRRKLLRRNRRRRCPLFVEARLVEIIGDDGRRLHTGRSRNDQVATDVRLWLRDEIDSLSQK
jgi:argininosuccinate lyase